MSTNGDLIVEARETQKVVTERLVLKYGEDTGNHLLDRLADALGVNQSVTEQALRSRLTVAEAIISRANHCVREEFVREQVLAVLNNPLPPMPKEQ